VGNGVKKYRGSFWKLFSVETAIPFTYKVLRYFIGADAKLIKRKEKQDDEGISFIIRHDGGDKFSTFVHAVFTISLTLFL
jgi:hypothetical protein